MQPTKPQNILLTPLVDTINFGQQPNGYSLSIRQDGSIQLTYVNSSGDVIITPDLVGADEEQLRQAANAFAIAAEWVSMAAYDYRQLVAARHGDTIIVDQIPFTVSYTDQGEQRCQEIYLTCSDPKIVSFHGRLYQDYNVIHVRDRQTRSAIWERLELIEALSTGNYVIE